jgi:serine/threonine-protein kinase
MSPEQAAGQAVDHRSDIYSLGVIMYQVFAGHLPFDAESYMGVMTKHMFEQPLLPSHWTSELRGPLEDMIMRALQKKPEQRYQSMLQLRDDLERAHGGQALQPLAATNAEPVLAGFTGTQPALDNPWTSGEMPAAGMVLEDDDPVALPMQKRPVWLLWLIGVLVLGLAALSFGVWGGATQTSSAIPVAPAVAPSTEAPPGNAAPAVTEPGHAPAAPAAQAPSSVEQPAAVVRAPSGIDHAALSEKKPRANPAPKKAPHKRSPARRNRSEVVDPWQ